MTPQDLPNILASLFGDQVQTLAPGSYQVESADLRLLVLLSEDQNWLRLLMPIAPLESAQPFLQEFLEANFDETQVVRYAIAQDLLWVVYHHRLISLTLGDLKAAIQQLIVLSGSGLDDVFSQFVEKQIRQIIRAAKLQGQSMESTMQTLERFYQEGVMGDLESGEAARNETLAAWRRQLKQLWDEIDP